MTRHLIALVFSLSFFPGIHPPEVQKAVNKPTITLILPAGIPSESVQIHYMMSGSFGGNGAVVVPLPNQSIHIIEAHTDGETPTDLRIMVYAPDCKIVTIQLKVTADTAEEREIACERLPTVKLAGQIAPNDLAQSGHTRLFIRYVAPWASHFLGIKDGGLSEFSLAMVTPSDQGWFEVDLPDFSGEQEGDSSRKEAALRLELWQSPSTDQGAIDLSPVQTEFAVFPHFLKILPFYPRSLEFTGKSTE
jgi:hypothetical protein